MKSAVAMSQNNTADSLVNIINNTTSNALKIQNLFKLVDLYESKKQKIPASYYLKKTTETALLLKEENKKARILLKIGKLYNKNNNFIDAASVMEEALVFAKKTNDSTLICRLSNTLGLSYRRIDNDSKAMQHHLRALDLAAALKDIASQAIALNSIGIILAYQKKYDEALSHFDKALIIERKRENHKGIAINYNSIGWTNSLKGNHKKAIKFYTKSISENQIINNQRGIAICHTNLGKEYEILNNFDEALQNLNQAKKVFQQLDDDKNLARTNLYLGELYANNKYYSHAIKFLGQAIQIAEFNNHIRLQKNALELLSNVYFELGYFLNSHENLLAAYKLKDIIYDEQSKAIIEETQAKYNLRKTREEMLLLEKNNQLIQEIVIRQRVWLFVFTSLIITMIILLYIIVRSRQKLKISQRKLEKKNHSIETQKNKIDKQRKELEIINVAKDKFFSIIAHDLRNPFNALLNLSGIIIEDYENLRNDEVIEMLELINDSADKGHKLLENLLIWSQTQLGGIKVNPANFPIKRLCLDIKAEASLTAKNKNISIDISVDENHCVYADKNMTAVIVRNLLSNAIKFTNNNGSISITSKSNGTDCQLCIKDSGVGIAQNDLKKLFRIESNYSRKGTKQEKGTGLGLIIVKEFTERNKGKISVKSEINKGSQFCITLPAGK